jgi:hypothetical protein
MISDGYGEILSRSGAKSCNPPKTKWIETSKKKRRLGVKEKKGRERRVSARRELESKIEFFVNADIIAAKSIDISETGLSFDTEKPLKIHLRMDIDGELCDREAQFVWATRNSNGGMSYGFEFIPDPKESLF